mmetsp:Transcript_36530/g.111988  ORF Transcript_36530/g.111988 Transcript_36530/m.111988 type:complete len:377 (-) Transcript_36530:634-1764(-)
MFVGACCEESFKGVSELIPSLWLAKGFLCHKCIEIDCGVESLKAPDLLEVVGGNMHQLNAHRYELATRPQRCVVNLPEELLLRFGVDVRGPVPHGRRMARNLHVPAVRGGEVMPQRKHWVAILGHQDVPAVVACHICGGGAGGPCPRRVTTRRIRRIGVRAPFDGDHARNPLKVTKVAQGQERELRGSGWHEELLTRDLVRERHMHRAVSCGEEAAVNLRNQSCAARFRHILAAVLAPEHARRELGHLRLEALRKAQDGAVALFVVALPRLLWNRVEHARELVDGQEASVGVIDGKAGLLKHVANIVDICQRLVVDVDSPDVRDELYHRAVKRVHLWEPHPAQHLQRHRNDAVLDLEHLKLVEKGVAHTGGEVRLV